MLAFWPFSSPFTLNLADCDASSPRRRQGCWLVGQRRGCLPASGRRHRPSSVYKFEVTPSPQVDSIHYGSQCHDEHNEGAPLSSSFQCQLLPVSACWSVVGCQLARWLARCSHGPLAAVPFSKTNKRHAYAGHHGPRTAAGTTSRNPRSYFVCTATPRARCVHSSTSRSTLPWKLGTDGGVDHGGRGLAGVRARLRVWWVCTDSEYGPEDGCCCDSQKKKTRIFGCASLPNPPSKKKKIHGMAPVVQGNMTAKRGGRGMQRGPFASVGRRVRTE